MFEIANDSKPRDVKAISVLDKSRDVELRMLAGRREPGEVCRMAWGNRDIPFETSRELKFDSDGTSGDRIFFESFGASVQAKIYHGVLPYQFVSTDERDTALLLAAEALLVFGNNYNGLSRREGQYIVTISEGANAGDYTLGSFGYKPNPA